MHKLLLFVAALVAAVLFVGGTAVGQPSGSIDITSVDTADYPTITVGVNAPGGPEAGYPAKAFEVLQDGDPVRFTVAPIATSALEIMLVLDTSGSMQGEPIAAAKAAATEFLAALPPEIRVGVVAFSAQPTLLAAPTTDRGHLTAQIAQLEARGETALNDAVVLSAGQFTPAALDRAVVVLSDGGDTVSASSLDQAAAAAAGLRLHVVELLSVESNHAALEQLAAAGGGSVFASSDPAALSALYRDAAHALVNEYRIVYRTTAYGKVKLTVRVETAEGVLSDTTTFELPFVARYHATPQPLGAILLSIGAGTCFVSLLLMLLIGISTDRRGRRARAQLGVQRNLAHAPNISHLADRMSAAADGYLERRHRRRTLAAALEVAGISLRPGEFVVLVALATLVAGLAGLMLAGPLAFIALLVTIPLAARFIVGHLAQRRRTKFAEQLPDTLHMLTSTLRSGYGLLQALDSVAQEAAEPARAEFRRVLLEIRVGRDLTVALRAVADRMRSQDFEWVVGAIEINRETGGDLAAVLDNTGETIRERQQVVRQIRALTAEGRLSAYVLTGLPIAVALAMRFISPASFARLTSGPGLIMLGGGCVLLLVGWVWMKKLIRIEF